MSTSTLTAALAQYAVDEEPPRATERAVRALDEAAAAGARLVVLPEAALAPFGTDLPAAAREHARAFDEAITASAERHDLVAVAGSFTLAADGRVHNTVIVRGRDLRADYRKIHLYDAFGARESETIAPGAGLVSIDVDGIHVGLATCYDIRFPEQFVALARAGAQVVVVPMAWGAGEGKAEQLRVLQRARALDSTSVLLAADQVPAPGWSGRAARGVGGSVAVSPLGAVIAAAGADEELLVVEVDAEAVTEARSALPVLADRPELQTP
ncbi:nitrilase-related carbon-nitrogen hydrolase [Brachybacterium subflavum]|uniref:nitrilase-related carbon-nitrogen hydrolase n=1 Tax=Brachybacterium subflavum TaxID=2585206 RepID=UPI00187AB562|nr:nitrilase-related carbon-nitrogen hydrolase [Brachybacterium subflavum]